MILFPCVVFKFCASEKFVMYFVPFMKTLVLLDIEIIGPTSSVKTKLTDLQRIPLILPLTTS